MQNAFVELFNRNLTPLEFALTLRLEIKRQHHLRSCYEGNSRWHA